MRKARLKQAKSATVAYYHCVSRVVNREFVFRDPEKEEFVRLMRIYEGFCQVRVVAFCVMSNHFHVLVEVPRRPEELPTDEALVAHVRKTLGEKSADGLEWELNHLRSMGAHDGAEALRGRWFGRMWDISGYMKSVKQRFTQWFNGRHQRRGTLWEDRFRSVLVAGEAPALRTMAAYIDLNPVRAGICDDPKDYRWCGYAEAVAGGKRGRVAREALRFLVELSSMSKDWEKGTRTGVEIRRLWRCVLFGIPSGEGAQAEERAKGVSGATITKRRISRKHALKVLDEGGRLSEADYLRCRVRYFTDGAALGSRQFVEGVFDSKRIWFSKGRKTGARSLRGASLVPKPERIYNLRDLKTDVFG